MSQIRVINRGKERRMPLNQLGKSHDEFGEEIQEYVSNLCFINSGVVSWWTLIQMYFSALNRGLKKYCRRADKCVKIITIISHF